MNTSTSLRLRLPVLVLVLQVVIITLYAIFVTYDDNANAKIQNNETNPMNRDYPFFCRRAGDDLHPFWLPVGLFSISRLQWNGLQLSDSYIYHPVGHPAAGILPVLL